MIELLLLAPLFMSGRSRGSGLRNHPYYKELARKKKEFLDLNNPEFQTELEKYRKIKVGG